MQTVTCEVPQNDYPLCEGQGNKKNAIIDILEVLSLYGTQYMIRAHKYWDSIVVNWRKELLVCTSRKKVITLILL